MHGGRGYFQLLTLERAVMIYPQHDAQMLEVLDHQQEIQVNRRSIRHRGLGVAIVVAVLLAVVLVLGVFQSPSDGGGVDTTVPTIEQRQGA